MLSGIFIIFKSLGSSRCRILALALLLMYALVGFHAIAEQPVFPDAQLASDGPLLAVSQAGTCYLIDATSATQPRIITEVQLPGGRIMSLNLQRTRLFAGMSDGSLLFRNTADNLRPLTTSTLHLQRPITSLASRNDRLYAAAREFSIIDVHTSTPTILGHVPLKQSGRMVVGQQCAWLLSTGLKGPFVRRLEWPDETAPRVNKQILPFNWTRLALNGNRAAAANPDGLALFDLEKPDEPRLLAQQPGTGEVRDLFLTSTTLFVAGTSGFEIYDVSRALQFVRLGGLEFPATAIAVRASGEFAYVLDETGFLHIVHVQATEEPNEVATLPLGTAAKTTPAVRPRLDLRQLIKQRQHHTTGTTVTEPRRPVLQNGKLRLQ